MTAGERLERAVELLDQAGAEMEAAEPDVPAYAVESLAFLRAEVKVARRRATNVAKVLGRMGLEQR